MKFKILVIDDEYTERQNFYDAILAGLYELVFVESQNNIFNEINNFSGEAFIIDLFLDQNGWNGSIKIEDILTHIKEMEIHIPIFLISRLWNRIDDIPLMNLLNRIIDFGNRICVLSWFEFVSASTDAHIQAAILHKFEQIFRETYKLVSNQKSSEISILHISDLQFGDKAYDKRAVFTEYDIPRYLTKVEIVPDILVVTGDIAFSGKSSEYQIALDWFKVFCTGLWGNNFDSSRILLVPGNHDIDYSYHIPNYYEFEFPFEERKIRKMTSNNDYSKHVLANFREFAYQLTNNTDYLLPENNLTVINNSFLSHGIRLFLFNSEPLFENHIYQKKHLLNLVKEKTDKRAFNILISHKGAFHFGYNKDNHDTSDLWEMVSNMIESAGINMHLFGHSHIAASGVLGDDRGIYTNRLYYVSASTLHIDQFKNKKQCERGFNTIRFTRNNGNLVSLDIISHRFEGSNIIQRRCEHYDI